MATITKENIGTLNEKITLQLAKTDYLPAFEKSLKEYSKKANIPGFRKGMVPAGLIRKMYGASVFTDEVLRTVDRELIKYLENEKLDIFAQPLPVEMDIRQLDVNNPADYTFHFEVGMKPDFQLPDLATLPLERYQVEVNDTMVDEEITRLQNRYGNMKDQDKAETEDSVLNVTFTEVDENANETEGGIKKDNSVLLKYFREDFRAKLQGKAVNDFVVASLEEAFDDKEREWISSDLGLDPQDEQAKSKHFRIQITKIGLLEKRELNEEFFEQVFPGQEVKTQADFRNKIKEQIEAYWNNQTRSHLQHMIYHKLLEATQIDFPESFLKKWIKTQGQEAGQKTDEEVENEFPSFREQLKWTLITDKITQENNIEVEPAEIREFAKQQLFGYMGMAGMEDQPWVENYIEKMMKDRKYVEESYSRIRSQKILDWAESKTNPTTKPIDRESFLKEQEAHRH